MVATAIITSGALKQDGDTEVIWIDATTSITPNFTTNITEHPIESGSSISDHVYMRNTTIKIEGVIGGSNSLYEFQDNLVDSSTLIASPQGNTVNKAANPRVKRAYDEIRQLFDAREPFTLISRLERYPNCIIRSLSLPQNTETSEVLMISMEIEQLRIVSSEEIALLVIEPKQDDATGNTQRGAGQSQQLNSEIIKFLLDSSETLTGSTAAWEQSLAESADTAVTDLSRRFFQDTPAEGTQ